MIKIFIETEGGSYYRKVYDEKTYEYKGMGRRRLSPPYPYPYGFIIGTRAADGDCVDCYVITNDSLKSGTIVEGEPIGLLEQDEDGEIDHKVLAALPGQDVVLDQELLEQLRDFIDAIFVHFPRLSVTVGRILPREVALEHIRSSTS